MFRFILALFLILPLVASAKAPEIKIPAQEIEVLDSDEGLHRAGDFGNFHLFGYGELHYNGRIGPAANEVDFHRLVLGFGYDFTDRIEFRAELDFEHAFTEPELEFAQVDFAIRDWLNVRVGALLVPMGVMNQHHEPPLFYSVERPDFYRLIIPTTWQEAGAGFFGKLPQGFDYQLYVLSMPSAAELAGGAIDRSFNGSNGIRGGRGHIAEAPGSDFGVAGRLQYRGVKNLRLGTSTLIGSTDHGKQAIDTALLSMIEADAKYSFEGIDLEGAFAFINLSDTADINNFLVTAVPTFTNFVASQMVGFYVEAAYHLFHHLLPNTKHDLVAFTRFEDINTQAKMPGGFAANQANNRNTVTVGMSYLPIPQVAIKADYNFNWNQANAGVDQFNLGLGFYY